MCGFDIQDEGLSQGKPCRYNGFMTRAEWRRRADDPPSLLGWWWRVVVGSGFGTQVLFSAVGFGAFFVSGEPLYLAPMVLAMAISNGVRSLRAPDPLKVLLPEPPPEGQFRALVTYRQKGTTLGTDEMALSLVDGWLYAEGVRSHFSVRPEDVWRLERGASEVVRLVLVDGEEIEVAPLDSDAYASLGNWHVPDRWMDGEPTFPPSRVHPQELAKWGARMTVAILIFSLSIGLQSLIMRSAEARIGVRFAGCAIGGLLMVHVVRALDKLIAIDRSGREALAQQAPQLDRRSPIQEEPYGEGESLGA